MLVAERVSLVTVIVSHKPRFTPYRPSPAPRRPLPARYPLRLAMVISSNKENSPSCTLVALHAPGMNALMGVSGWPPPPPRPLLARGS